MLASRLGSFAHSKEAKNERDINRRTVICRCFVSVSSAGEASKRQFQRPALVALTRRSFFFGGLGGLPLRWDGSQGALVVLEPEPTRPKAFPRFFSSDMQQS